MPPAAAPPAPTVARRRMRATFRALPDEGEGQFEALVSAYNTVYSVGWFWREKIVSGCFTESIAENPIVPVFYEHLWEDMPIGSGTASEISMGVIVRGHLYLDIDPQLRRIWQSMVDDAVREWSIAFYASAIEYDDDDPTLDIITKGELIEASVCIRGANPGTETIDLRSEPVWIDAPTEEQRKAEVVRLRSGRPGSAAPGGEPEPQRRVLRSSKLRRRKAIASHSTDTTEATWDGAEAEKALSNDDGADVYRDEYAWVDPDKDADTKAAYKFPHHEVSDNTPGAANLNACRSVIANLNGARGGTDIPDDDVQGVYDHVAKHISDGGGEPAELETASAAAVARWRKVCKRLQIPVTRADDEEYDTGELAQAVDAAIDALETALDAGEDDQADALVVAAEVAVDALLEALDVPDADDAETEPGASAASAAPAFERLLSSREGRRLLSQQTGSASGSSSSPPMNDTSLEGATSA